MLSRDLPRSVLRWPGSPPSCLGPGWRCASPSGESSHEGLAFGEEAIRIAETGDPHYSLVVGCAGLGNVCVVEGYFASRRRDPGARPGMRPSRAHHERLAFRRLRPGSGIRGHRARRRGAAAARAGGRAGGGHEADGPSPPPTGPACRGASRAPAGPSARFRSPPRPSTSHRSIVSADTRRMRSGCSPRSLSNVRCRSSTGPKRATGRRSPSPRRSACDDSRRIATLAWAACIGDGAILEAAAAELATVCDLFQAMRMTFWLHEHHRSDDDGLTNCVPDSCPRRRSSAFSNGRPATIGRTASSRRTSTSCARRATSPSRCSRELGRRGSTFAERMREQRGLGYYDTPPRSR